MNGMLGTMLVLMILLLIVGLIIRGMIRDKKAGKSVICGGSCETCGGCAAHGNMGSEYTAHDVSDAENGSTRTSVCGVHAAHSGACASCGSSCAYYNRCPRCKS
jgi:hypothetical protein